MRTGRAVLDPQRLLLGAKRVIAIDTVPERLRIADAAGAITIDFMKEDVYDRIQELTHGHGADACIDAVGIEPHTSASFDSMLDRAKVAVFAGTDRPHVLRQAINNTRNFGVVSIIGVYGGFVDKAPMGSAINRGLTFRMAQTPVQHYLPKLMALIEQGKIDPSVVITHRVGLEDGPAMYKTFRDKQDGCIKVVMKPSIKETQTSASSPSSPAHPPGSVTSLPGIARRMASIC